MVKVASTTRDANFLARQQQGNDSMGRPGITLASAGLVVLCPTSRLAGLVIPSGDAVG